MKNHFAILVVIAASAWTQEIRGESQNSPSPVDVTGDSAPAGAVWLETLDLKNTVTGFGLPTTGATVSGNPLSIAGKAFVHGIGTHADASFTLALGGRAERFVAEVGVDDDLKCFESKGATKSPSVEFTVWVDGRKTASSGFLGFGSKPVPMDVSLRGARTLRLVVTKAQGSHFNHASWAGAAVFVRPGSQMPTAVATKKVGLSAQVEAKMRGSNADATTVWLDSLDLTKARVDPGNLWLGAVVSRAPRDPQPFTARKTPKGDPLRMATVAYSHGIASQGENELRIDLGGVARRFVARVGFNTSMSCSKVSSGGDALFEVWVDGRPVVQTPHMHGYDPAYDIDVDLIGAKLLVLNATSDGGPVVWAGAFLDVVPGTSVRPRTVAAPPPLSANIAKRVPDELRINGPRVVGATPRRPFVFRVPATGKAPLQFFATNLPQGLALDGSTGTIAGSIKNPGTTRVQLKVVAANGVTERTLTIVAGHDKLALTPPMGWNSWNVWGMNVDDEKVRAAADALVSSGLAAQGYQYINIDEGWSDGRDDAGNIRPSAKFPNMRALSDYVHSKGLRLGIHNSPGPKTCGGSEGSYQHELQDASTWASWGIDFLKHDWCSYGGIAKNNSLFELQKPYKIMRAALARTGRDVVFSLCQYGMGDVWNWGRDVGGNLWRTGADIVDTWASVSDVGFIQSGRRGQIGPGGWSDPDMMVVGRLGWGDAVRATRLTQDEQVAHVTLWSMLASPLLLGNDLSTLDEFTADLLQNPEIIDVNQDPLGRPGERKSRDGGVELWVRPLYDGSIAVSFFNRGQVPAQGVAQWAALGIKAKPMVRDLWLRKDLGRFDKRIEVQVPPHGAVMLRII